MLNFLGVLLSLLLVPPGGVFGSSISAGGGGDIGGTISMCGAANVGCCKDLGTFLGSFVCKNEYRRYVFKF